jgi:hypothetical protein
MAPTTMAMVLQPSSASRHRAKKYPSGTSSLQNPKQGNYKQAVILGGRHFPSGFSGLLKVLHFPTLA